MSDIYATLKIHTSQSVVFGSISLRKQLQSMSLGLPTRVPGAIITNMSEQRGGEGTEPADLFLARLTRLRDGDFFDTSDDYEALGQEYEKLIDVARQRKKKDLIAAALVDIEGSGELNNPADTIERSFIVADAIGGWQEFIADNPDEPILVFDGPRIFLMRTKKMALRRSGTDESMLLEAPFQECATTHTGKLDYIQGNDKDGSGSGSTSAVIKFRQIAFGVDTLAGGGTPPIVAGKENIIHLFGNLAEEESSHGLTENRLRSVPYILWLMRHQNSTLADKLDEVAENYSLKDAWAEQFVREIGASIAYAQKNSRSDNEKEIELYFMQRAGMRLAHEMEELGVVSDQIKSSTIEACNRMSITFDAHYLDKVLGLLTR